VYSLLALERSRYYSIVVVVFSHRRRLRVSKLFSVDSHSGQSQLQRGPALRCLSAMEVNVEYFYMYEKG